MLRIENPAPTIPHPGYVANNWYGSFNRSGTLSAGGAAFVAGSIYCSPIFIHRRVTLHALAARISTLDAAGNIQLAVYARDPLVPNRPGAKLGNTASITTATATSVSAVLGADVVIEPGWYWLCLQSDSTTVRMASYTHSSDQGTMALLGSATLANTTIAVGAIQGVSTTGAFGTWPANLNGSTWTEIITALVPHIVWQPNAV